MPLNFNNAPYFDDYSQEKGFLKILFKPGYAVQARELTQLQDILQNQISSFGAFTFKSGSPVLGGQISLDTDVTYANLNPLYNNTAITVTQFANSVITDAATQTVRASVIATLPQLGSNPPTLMLKYLTGVTFANGANVTIEGSQSGPFALLANSNATGTGSCASVQDGIFYLNLSNLTPTTNANANLVSITTNGYFVRVPQQTIVLDAYDNNPTYSVGLQVADGIVTSLTDTTLLDPALGSSNYQAPGADRYIINATLSTRQLNSQDTSSFVQLLTVQNGQLQSIVTDPELGRIMNTLAQRTYDQSGSFTVKPFVLQLLDTANNDIANSNTTLYYAQLNPGNAYVKGFQYQTIAKSYLNAPRAQTIANVSNYNLQDYFGNYFYVDTVQGEFNFGTLPALDLHCVNTSSVNVTSSTGYSATLLGTARLRSFEYNSAANTSNPLTHVYRASLFLINTAPITLTVSSATATTVTFNTPANQAANAYYGMYLLNANTGDTRFITSYNGSTRTATVASNFSTTPVSGNIIQIISNLNSVDSLGLNTMSSFITANSNINIGSKVQSNTYQYSFLSDSAFTTLIYRFPNFSIAQGLQNPSYQYRARIATGQTLSPGVGLNISLSIPNDPSATFASGAEGGSDLISLSDFLVVTNPGGGVAGQIIPMVSALGRSISTTSTSATLTTNSGDPTFNNVDIFASVKTTIGAKTKTLISANTTSNTASGGVSTGPATVFTATGQVNYGTPTTSNLCTPGAPQDLYISDVINIVAIIDSGNPGTPVTNAMIQAAVNNTAMPGNSSNITANYTFNNGQTDTFYDHATITLNQGSKIPQGQVLVLLNYYQPSTTGGYFSVDSYPTYSTIPVYNSPTTATSYYLRDCIDWRPVRDSSTTGYSFGNAGTIFLPEPVPSTTFNVGYGYYLGRIDKLVLNKQGNFNIIQGASSLSPQPPATPQDSMLLYTLVLPPFTPYAANIAITQHNNQRYTMADIGKLEKRIQTLEYYNSLNQVEQAATNQQITDSNGLTVPQLGLLVDAFTGSSVADVLSPDYFAAIDQQSMQLRPPFAIENAPLVFDPSSSTNYAQNGRVITLAYSTTPFISQNAASRTENLNPFNITVWNGTMALYPSSDTWVNTTSIPAVTTNLSGDNDGWQAGSSQVFGTVWNDWQTVWTGVSTDTTVQTGATYLGGQAPVYVDAAHASGGYYAYQQLQNQVTTTTTTTSQDQTRTGVQLTLSTDNITVPAGTNLVSVSVIPYMRSMVVSWAARSMKPLTKVYPFFDNINVTPYTMGAGIITFTSNVSFQWTGAEGEMILDQDGGMNNGHGANSSRVILVRDNKAWVANVGGVCYPGKTFKGVTSGATGVVASYEHHSGFTGEIAGTLYQASAPASIGLNTIQLQGAASNANGYYVGNTIYVSSGQYLGTSANIISYNGTTRVATVDHNWVSANVTGNFWYQIGSLQTDNIGDIAGRFVIPATSALEFPTGTSTFMITDAVNGDVSTATTKGITQYNAQGTLDTIQQQYVSVGVPVLTTQTVSQNQVLTSSASVSQAQTNVVGYYDPLAQTFLIDPTVYPNGVFITSIRLCFFSKDNVLPVTLQLRPTDNGYPSSSNILPFSQVTLSPSQVNTTTSPSLDAAGAYTEFFFDSPLQLLPGFEFAIVLVSNSNNYQVYTAMVGDTYLGSTQVISKPPYLGVLFKSQNASTWTAYQGESLMFRVNKAVFNNSASGFVTFKNQGYLANTPVQAVPNSDIYIDTMYLTNNDQTSNNTSLAYGFRGTANSSRAFDSSYSSFIPNQNYQFSNRYVLTSSYGSFAVQAQMQSPSPDISPQIDAERYSLMAVSNIINNGSIGNNNITITNPGEGYNVSCTNIFTITGDGSSASLGIGSLDANGNITSIIVTGPGSSYNETPNVAITTSGYSPSITATAVIAGETNSSGGNYFARYMTRSVTLSSGINAGNLQVWLDAYLPSGTNIYVYYKILSSTDPTPFAQRPWVLMTLNGTQAVATIPNSFTTYQYVGAVNQYGNPINSISYGTYYTFNQFAIKIVMASSNQSIVPIVKNLRAYALPSSS